MRAIPTKLRPALEQYRDRLRVLFGARLRDVILFGSMARGDDHAESDVDVLVLVDGLTHEESLDAVTELTPIILETLLPLEPLPMSTEHLEELRRAERLLAREIDADGVSL